MRAPGRSGAEGIGEVSGSTRAATESMRGGPTGCGRVGVLRWAGAAVGSGPETAS